MAESCSRTAVDYPSLLIYLAFLKTISIFCQLHYVHRIDKEQQMESRCGEMEAVNSEGISRQLFYADS